MYILPIQPSGVKGNLDLGGTDMDAAMLSAAEYAISAVFPEFSKKSTQSDPARFA